MASWMTRDVTLGGMVLILVTAFVLAGCSGSGGGGTTASGGSAIVLETSFQGYPSAPGATLPSVYRNEVLLLTFSTPLDAAILGGFETDPLTGQPVVYQGISSSSLIGVQYHVWNDQLGASAALQLWDDSTGLQFNQVYVGRSVADPRIIVIDPKVPDGNVFGVPASLGFLASTQFDVFIPAGSGLSSGGTSVPTFGAQPPVAVPAFTGSPTTSTIFRTGVAFTPDAVPPTVVEVTTLTLNGADPALTSIPDDDTVRVTFSEPVDLSTINPQSNMMVRNLTVVTTADPSGVLVPMNQTTDAINRVFFLTPVPSFGAGPYQIQVSVGANTDPVDDIKDLPAGANATQNSLANSLTRVFTTIINPGANTAASIGEDFSDNVRQDLGFTPRYNDAAWNDGGSGMLTGKTISGTAQPSVGLGTRIQYAIQPAAPVNPATGSLGVFFAPFDDNATNNLGGTINPQGGSHTQLLYNANNTDLPDFLTNSIELVEWGANQGLGNAFTYNNFRMLLSATTARAYGTSPIGLLTIYNQNFDFDNPQNAWINPTGHPANAAGFGLNEAPIEVVAQSAYVITAFASTYVPFPAFNPLFDFDGAQGRTEPSAISGSSAEAPNVVVDIDIQPPVNPSNNFILGTFPTSPTPARRVTAASLATLGNFTDAVIYWMRFTAVDKNSSARSSMLDLGVVAQDADYGALQIIPDISAQPAGTVVVVKIEAADAVLNGEPTVGGSGPTGLVTYIDRNGVTDPNAVDMMDGRRFFRITFEFESNTSTNLSPFIDGWILGYEF